MASETKDTSASRRGRTEKRPGPIARLSLFVRQVIAELRKVVWPTREQLLTYTAVVLVFVGIVIAIVTVLDLAFGKAVFWVFG